MTRRMLGALVAVIAVAFGTTAVAIGGVPHQKDSNSVFKYSGNVSDSVDPQNPDNDVVKFDTTDPTVVDSMGRKLGLAGDKVVVTIDRHANTSAASIPLALAEAVGDGRIRPGHLVLMEAMGGGLTWGASLARW